MSDYSAVAPPQSSNSNVAFAEALHRARLIAAKINPGSGEHAGQKRPLEDGPGSGMDWTEPEAKKPAGNINDYASMRQPSNMAGNPGMRPGMGGVVTEDIRVPDKMVGLIIGRGGEQITRLQNEAGCKIQMASDSHGLPDRLCTITGTRDAINRARDMIMGIINQRGNKEGDLPGFDTFESRGGGGGGGGGGHMGQNSVEMMVPGNKVGLVIGKGGETIKQLQEKSGAKLVIIQDGPETEMEKALRITGDPQTIEYAKQLVYELISDKDAQFNRGGGGGGGGGGFRGGPGGFGGGGGGGGDQTEVAVPKAAVGVVIGKGGDMIKKIQSETGARVQFHQGRDEGPGERRCILSGSPSQVAEAKQRIEELIDSVSRRDNDGGRGRGKPGGRENGGPGDRNGFGNNWDRRGGGPGQMDKHEITLSVPANKCGIIIGRGGETIKQINHQTGAHCELDRRPPPNPNEKLFIVKGSADQIENAKRMMTDKIGVPPTVLSGGPPPSTQYPVGGQQQQFNQGGWGGGYQQWQNSGQGDPNSVQINPQTGQPDYSMQWAEYYRSLGMIREAEMIEQQAKAQKEGLVIDQTMPPTAATPAMAPQQAPPQAVPTNGQPDYSMQWAEYYRSIGKVKEAEAIEAQMKAKEAGQVPPPGATPTGPPSGAQMPGGQAYQYGYSNYYGGQGQPPSGMPNQSYGGYPAYGGYGGGQPQGPDN